MKMGRKDLAWGAPAGSRDGSERAANPEVTCSVVGTSTQSSPVKNLRENTHALLGNSSAFSARPPVKCCH